MNLKEMYHKEIFYIDLKKQLIITDVFQLIK
jgi:hypothetical protein